MLNFYLHNLTKKQNNIFSASKQSVALNEFNYSCSLVTAEPQKDSASCPDCISFLKATYNQFLTLTVNRLLMKTSIDR